MITLPLGTFLVFLTLTVFLLPAFIRLAKKSEESESERIACILADRIAKEVKQ